MKAKNPNLKQVISAAQEEVAAVRREVDLEIAKLQSAMAGEIGRLEAYIGALKEAARLSTTGGAAPKKRGRKPGRKPRQVKAVKAKRGPAKKVAAKRGRPVGSKKANGATKFRAGSVPDQLRSMILKSKKPVHLSDVAKQLGRGGKPASLQSIENRISSLARKAHSFVRTGARTYGLIELGHK